MGGIGRKVTRCPRPASAGRMRPSHSRAEKDPPSRPKTLRRGARPSVAAMFSLPPRLVAAALGGCSGPSRRSSSPQTTARSTRWKASSSSAGCSLSSRLPSFVRRTRPRRGGFAASPPRSAAPSASSPRRSCSSRSARARRRARDGRQHRTRGGGRDPSAGPGAARGAVGDRSPHDHEFQRHEAPHDDGRADRLRQPSSVLSTRECPGMAGPSGPLGRA